MGGDLNLKKSWHPVLMRYVSHQLCLMTVPGSPVEGVEAGPKLFIRKSLGYDTLAEYKC